MRSDSGGSRVAVGSNSLWGYTVMWHEADSTTAICLSDELAKLSASQTQLAEGDSCVPVVPGYTLMSLGITGTTIRDDPCQ